MAAAVKFEKFSEDLVNGVHNFTSHTCKILLALSAPSASLDAVKADLTDELGTAGGYTAGGTATTISVSRSGGTTTVDGTNVVFTAFGGDIGPFRYAVLYNDTPTSPADPLIQYWDYGSNVTITNGNTFTVDTGAGTGNDLFTVA